MILVRKMATFANDFVVWCNFKIAQLFCWSTDDPTDSLLEEKNHWEAQETPTCGLSMRLVANFFEFCTNSTQISEKSSETIID